MKRCFLFEGIGIGSLQEFFYYFIRDFDFRELSIFFSKKIDHNIPGSIHSPDDDEIHLMDQINTTLSNVIAFQRLKNSEIVPDFVAGHSLGVYSAIYASGAVNLSDTILLVKEIHKLLKDAFHDEDFLSAIIIAPSMQQLRQVLLAKSKPDKPMYISNINTPKQAVVCGPKESVRTLFSYFHDINKLPEKRLSISYPVHTPYITYLKQKLYEIIGQISIDDPAIPVINTVNQAYITSSNEIRDYIVSNLCNPVHWLNTIEYNKEGVVFYDIGLRYYLSQLMFWIDKKTKCFNLKKNIERNSFING